MSSILCCSVNDIAVIYSCLLWSKYAFYMWYVLWLVAYNYGDFWRPVSQLWVFVMVSYCSWSRWKQINEMMWDDFRFPAQVSVFRPIKTNRVIFISNYWLDRTSVQLAFDGYSLLRTNLVLYMYCYSYYVYSCGSNINNKNYYHHHNSTKQTWIICLSDQLSLYLLLALCMQCNHIWKRVRLNVYYRGVCKFTLWISLHLLLKCRPTLRILFSAYCFVTFTYMYCIWYALWLPVTGSGTVSYAFERPILFNRFKPIDVRYWVCNELQFLLFPFTHFHLIVDTVKQQ